MTKHRLLRSKMIIFGDDIESLADYLEISVSTLNRRLQGKSSWKHEEMQMIKLRYHLTELEFWEAFDEIIRAPVPGFREVKEL